MSKFKTQYGLYYINLSRTEGYSLFFDTLSEALSARNNAPQTGLCFTTEQTYELEEQMSSIRSILDKLAFDAMFYGQNPEGNSKPTIDQTLLEIRRIINPIISGIDRLYTDEYDRKLWNEFKYEVQSNLKEALK